MEKNRRGGSAYTTMMNIEVRFFALLMLTVITIYIVFDTQRESNLSTELHKINRLLRRSGRHSSSPSSSSTQNKESEEKEKLSEDENELAWLDRNDSKPYRDYGDETCGINTDRMGFLFLIRKWQEIAKANNIRYFLDFGSLLGAWRDEETIPYDADTDIRVHNDDLETLFNLSIRVRKMSWDSYDDNGVHLYFTKDWRKPYHMRRRFSCKGKEVPDYEGQCSFTDPTARLIHRQWHLDLFVYTDYHDTILFIPDGRPAFLKNDFLPLVRCDFMGIEVRCPKKPRLVLQEHYSNLMPSKVCFNKTWYESSEPIMKLIHSKKNTK
eukprot:TCONS_00064820-protein